MFSAAICASQCKLCRLCVNAQLSALLYKHKPVHKVCDLLGVVDRSVMVAISRVGMRDPVGQPPVGYVP